MFKIVISAITITAILGYKICKNIMNDNLKEALISEIEFFCFVAVLMELI